MGAGAWLGNSLGLRQPLDPDVEMTDSDSLFVAVPAVLESGRWGLADQLPPDAEHRGDGPGRVGDWASARGGRCLCRRRAATGAS